MSNPSNNSKQEKDPASCEAGEKEYSGLSTYPLQVKIFL